MNGPARGILHLCGIAATTLLLLAAGARDAAEADGTSATLATSSEGEVPESGGATLADEELTTAADWIVPKRPDRNPAAAPQIEGRFRKVSEDAPASEPNAEQKAMIEQLEAIGYATGSREAPIERGITVYDAERAQPGLNLYTSGHAPEAVLMDMEGRVVHRWQHAFRDAFPDWKPTGRNRNPRFWRRAVALEGGELIALHAGIGILKLDRDSNLLWAHPHPVHHDFEVTEDGNIVVLTRRAHIVPRVSEVMPILEDFVAVLGGDGQMMREISLLDAFENAAEEHSWIDASRRFWEVEKTRRRASGRRGTSLDIFHTNSVQVLGAEHAGGPSGFQTGNLMISACHLDTIAVVDMNGPEVTWSLSGRFQLQHDPRVLPGGRVMVFDNQWKPDASRVAIVDPVTQETLWEYGGSEERPFYSRTCGTARRLANDNVLVTESDGGRAFEITPDKRIVWEFYSPHRAGEQGEFIATLFEVSRLPSEFGASWLTRGTVARGGSGP